MSRFLNVRQVINSFLCALCFSSSLHASSFNKEEVIIFTAEWCGYCKQAKAFMASNAIEFTELDLDKSDHHLDQFEAMGGTGIPYLVVGKESLYGFNPSDYKRVLDIQ